MFEDENIFCITIHYVEDIVANGTVATMLTREIFDK